jgi:hypothetical protein
MWLNNMKINTQQLEKLLCKKWIEFIDTREIFSYLQKVAVQNLNLNEKYQTTNVKFSRFEIQSNHFIVWIDYSLSMGKIVVNVTSEFSLQRDKLIHIRSILNNS